MLTKLFGFARGRVIIVTLAQLLFMASVLGVCGSVFAQPQNAKKKPAELSKREPGRVAESQRLLILPFRLHPGQDVRQQIEAFVKAHNIRAGFILTAVGSLRSATIRLADQKDSTTFAGKFEIVSLVGTLGQDGVHLHISIADSTGKTIGGHLVEGCLVYTTVEIVVAEARGLTFAREQDAETGYKELIIRTGRD
jgi:predicted DNA-binding protein with PD1-like motif